MSEFFDPDTGEVYDARFSDADIETFAQIAGVDFETASNMISEGSPVLDFEVDRSNLDDLTDDQYHQYFAGELLSADGLHLDSGFSGTERHYQEAFDSFGAAVDYAQRMVAGDEGAFFARATEDMKLSQDEYGTWYLDWDTFDPVGDEWYEGA